MFYTDCEDNDKAMTDVSNMSLIGPIEVCLNNTWHRVCGANWLKADAIDFCQNLGLNYTSKTNIVATALTWFDFDFRFRGNIFE